MRSNYDIINELDKNGELKPLIRSGLVPVKIGTYLEIYRYVDARVKTGDKITQAVETTAENMRLCRRTVFKVIRFFK